MVQSNLTWGPLILIFNGLYGNIAHFNNQMNKENLRIWPKNFGQVHGPLITN